MADAMAKAFKNGDDVWYASRTHGKLPAKVVASDRCASVKLNIRDGYVATGKVTAEDRDGNNRSDTNANI